MAAPGSMDSGAFAFMPPNSTSNIQQGWEVSGATFQTPQVIQHGPQQFRVVAPESQLFESIYPRNADEQVAELRKAGMMEAFLKAQPKTLGAIQILTGLMIIGCGSISTIFIRLRVSISAVSGYPFWAGTLFVISGSLLVAAENHRHIRLVRMSQRINNTSATASSLGIIVLITELILNGSYHDNYENAKRAITVMLLLMTILEFSITVSASHAVLQAMCYTPDTSMLFMPYAASANLGVPSAPMPPPPPYTNEAYEPREETEEAASGGSSVRDCASSSCSEDKTQPHPG